MFKLINLEFFKYLTESSDLSNINISYLIIIFV